MNIRWIVTSILLSVSLHAMHEAPVVSLDMHDHRYSQDYNVQLADGRKLMVWVSHDDIVCHVKQTNGVLQRISDSIGQNVAAAYQAYKRGKPVAHITISLPRS